MEELLELRQYIEQKQYDQALDLIGEMEEMSREDKINKIGSFIKVLLIHLIKRQAEKRTTRSWDTSIFNALFEIKKANTRQKSGGFYMTRDEINETLKEYYPVALRYAALEAFDGQYNETELNEMVDQNLIIEQALALITESPG
jgi:hypothetical protein